MKKFLVFLLTMVLVFSMSVTSIGKTSKELEADRQEIQKKIQDIEAKQNELNQQKKNIQSELERVKNEGNKVAIEIVSLDADVAEAEGEIFYLESQIAIKEGLLTDTQSELENAEQTRELYYEILKERIKYMYENGDINYLDIILQSKNFINLLNKIEYINDIIEHDDKVMEEMKKLEKEIADSIELIKIEKNNLEILQKEQVEKKHSLDAVIEKKQQQIIKLNADEAALAQQITNTNASIEEEQRLLEEAREQEDKIVKDIAIAAAKEAQARAEAEKAANANKYTGGLMSWPLNGYYAISSGYINRINPISGKAEKHRGIDIPAPKGTPVLAAADGEVIESNYSYSYGNKVIIYHGGNISTLYAHNSKLLVSVGDKVKRGDTIALVGSTGDSTGNHCHFEVRVNGEHTDPIPYLKGNQ